LAPERLSAAPITGREARFAGLLGHYTAITGFVLYSVFLPHSVAAADISIAVATVGWLVRTIASRQTGLRRTQFDLPILLFLLWTILSAFLSLEPEISVSKLQASWVPMVFYLTQAILTRRTVVFLVSLAVLSGVAGTVYSFYDLARGRGIVVESVSDPSPFRPLQIRPGDTIWRVDGRRIYSTQALDELLRQAVPEKPLVVGLIVDGEQIERPGLMVSTEAQSRVSPSGIRGRDRLHSFRASGWTRHYETFAELIQLLAQLALGLALANFLNHGSNVRFRLALGASLFLSLGIALTAMRTALVAFVIGALVIVWRSLQGRMKLILSGAIALLLVIGGLVVWRTRASSALTLGDPSSSLRVQVAQVGLSRILMHPVFGHGMDSMHRHWNEWGFPGRDMLHLHSTPLQLAFDRGLPALVFWLWLVGAFWLVAARAERSSRDSSDTNRHGLQLGVAGALTGFLASSLVNYNFGDAEVALAFYWLLGITVVLADKNQITSAKFLRVRANHQ